MRVIQEQLSVDRNRRSYARALPGAVVDFIGNRIQLLLAVPSQVGALGKVLANTAVDVLVGAQLPGAVWIAEVHGNAVGFGQLFAPCHLSALVVRHALAHRGNLPLLQGPQK